MLSLLLWTQIICHNRKRILEIIFPIVEQLAKMFLYKVTTDVLSRYSTISLFAKALGVVGPS
jgi:transcription elongation factor GreA-like protein